MRVFLGGLIVAAALAVAAGPVRAQRLGGDDWDDKAVEEAIKRAVEFLWSSWANGSWEGGGAPGGNAGQNANFGGSSALCCYALLAAGERPQDPRVKQTLQWLAGLEMRGTYARSLRCNVWALLGRNHKYRKQFMQDVAYLVNGVDGRGGFDYIPHGKPGAPTEDPGRNRPTNVRYDNSNTQLGDLGIWVGNESGAEVPMWFWQLTERHWVQDQCEDGGWCYQNRGESYGSMSVAGLASMFICFDAIYYKKFVRCAADTDYPPIVKGLEWMDKNFSATSNPRKGMQWYYYYLYGVERVGLASGYKYFGDKDWYKMGATALLQRQRGNGSWGSIVDTSFALLFLARGRHPILFNKLNYPGTWNSRPRDLANLTRWVTRKFERTVNWQIVHLGAPVRDLHDAPILYISGASAPKFTDADVAKLREFVCQGGVILSEAACNRAPFTIGMKSIYQKMFPDYELKRLDADHPIYNLHFDISSTRRGLSAISNGARLLVIHSPRELSLAWQLRHTKTETDAFELGANVYFFVTDKGILSPRGVSRWPKARKFVPAETIKVTPVKYNGNWQPEPLAWTRFAILMGNLHRVKVEIDQPRELTGLDPAACPVAAMTGTTSVKLSDAEREGLRKYLSAGGTLVVDAAGGSKAFADAAEKELRDLLPGSRYGLIPSSHALFTKVGPAIEKVAYRRALRFAVYNKSKPRLRGVTLGNRLAIIFSPDDITAGLVGYPRWGMAGYEPDSAFELIRNILLYASGKAIAGKADAGFPQLEW